jgi:large subunit ribosomal protein L2
LRLFKRWFFLFEAIQKKHRVGIVFSSGRNFFGRICVQHQGGALKNKFLKIDRFRLLNQYGYVCRIVNHFFFSGSVGLIIYMNGLCNFVLLADGLRVGFSIFSGFLYSEVGIGSTSKLFVIKLFDSVHSIEFFPFSGFKLARSAGVFSYIFSRDYGKVNLKLPSGWQIKVSNFSLGSLGMVSNPAFFLVNVKKAGFFRNIGVRPSVRGVAKNPCDHPHGGGEGRGSPPVGQVSPWGWLCKGTPSKNKKKDRLLRHLYKSSFRHIKL